MKGQVDFPRPFFFDTDIRLLHDLDLLFLFFLFFFFFLYELLSENIIIYEEVKVVRAFQSLIETSYIGKGVTRGFSHSCLTVPESFLIYKKFFYKLSSLGMLPLRLRQVAVFCKSYFQALYL